MIGWLRGLLKKEKKYEVNGTVPNAIGVLQWEGLSRSESLRALVVLRDNAYKIETTVRIKMKQVREDDPLYFVDLPIESKKLIPKLIGLNLELRNEYQRIKRL